MLRPAKMRCVLVRSGCEMRRICTGAKAAGRAKNKEDVLDQNDCDELESFTFM